MKGYDLFGSHATLQKGQVTYMDPDVRVSKPDEQKTTPPKGWGDSEHDTRLHKNIKPHGGPHEINPEWGYCKEE